jgi:hypothetical protein
MVTIYEYIIRVVFMIFGFLIGLSLLNGVC